MSGEPEELVWAVHRQYEKPEPFRHLFVDVLSDKDATVARVAATITTPDGTASFEATGSSRRDRGDSYDQFTGDTLAIGRALVKLGQKLEKQAQSRINAAAAIKEHHAEIAARKTQEQAEDLVRGNGQVVAALNQYQTCGTVQWSAPSTPLPAQGARVIDTGPGGGGSSGSGSPNTVHVTDNGLGGQGGGGGTRFPGVSVETTPAEAPSPVFVEIPIPFGRKVRVSKLGEVQVLDLDGAELRSYYA